MEEDIEYIKELLALAKVLLYTAQPATIQEKEIEVLENLLARYKELEVINKMQEYRISVIDERELIPKSKVKEKIEELDKLEKNELKGVKGQDRYSIKQEYMFKRNILQELLED